MKTIRLLIPFLLLFLTAQIQLAGQNGSSEKFVMGPMQGYTSTTSLGIWLLTRDAGIVTCRLESEGFVSIEEIRNVARTNYWKGHVPHIFMFKGLQPGTSYRVRIAIDGEVVPGDFQVSTLAKNNGRDFSFLLGSCSYKGVGMDKIVEPKGPTFDIFNTMREEEKEFMIWMGDNFYFLNGEWNKIRRMSKKIINVREEPELNQFLMEGRHFATWDDHDFGPNNSDGTFKNKEKTLGIFRDFWPLPETAPGPGNGLYYSFAHQDVDFFMMDDRFNRVDKDHLQMWGPDQMKWLQNGLKSSRATFRIVVNGNQILNEISGHESLSEFKEETEALFNFIRDEKIEGVFFLSGDRHFTELLTKDKPGLYPVYDLTCSPLTSWLRKVAGRDEEASNPLRVPGTQIIDWNYGKITVFGPENDRKLKIEIKSREGDLFWEKVIPRSELSF